MNVFVKPGTAPDGTARLVRMPHRNWLPVPAEGAWVVLDEYWARRIRDEDVVEAAPPPETDEGDGVEKTPVPMTENADGSFTGELTSGADASAEPTPEPATKEPAASKRRGR